MWKTLCDVVMDLQRIIEKKAFRNILNTLYAFVLALPRIIFMPWREFQVVIPERGIPFVRNRVEDFSAGVNTARRTFETFGVLIKDLQTTVQKLEIMKPGVEKLELAELKKLSLAELDKLEIAEIKKLKSAESEKHKMEFDLTDIADRVLMIRQVKKAKEHHMHIQEFRGRRKDDFVDKTDYSVSKEKASGTDTLDIEGRAKE